MKLLLLFVRWEIMHARAKALNLTNTIMDRARRRVVSGY